jgi:hypothetical protein
MRFRKYAGVWLGVSLSLVLTTAALAGTITGSISNAGPGWNSPIYHANSQYFDIRYCRSSDSTLWFDAMHHWPAFPSTGTHKQMTYCYNNSTWRTLFWDNPGWADYSIEYVKSSAYNQATISASYRIRY